MEDVELETAEEALHPVMDHAGAAFAAARQSDAAQRLATRAGALPDLARPILGPAEAARGAALRRSAEAAARHATTCRSGADEAGQPWPR